MRQWIPTSGSARGRLVQAALAAFGTRPYGHVGVAELAAAANTTTGPLYHHFGSKLGLYTMVREDVERRVVDRIEDVLAVADASQGPAITAALVVAFDYLTRADLVAMLADPHPTREHDMIVDALAGAIGPAHPALAELVTAAWRAALTMVVRGQEAHEVRATLTMLLVAPPPDA